MSSIADLPEIIARLDSTERARLDRLFRVWSIEGTCTCPANMREWATRQFGSPDRIESQTVIRVQNLWTNEGALFNPLRSSRPTSRSERDVLDAVRSFVDRRARCPLCRPDEMTPFDPFGRIKGTHCVTASNAAKYDGKHGLIVFSEHDPLRFSQESMLDYFHVATQWFNRAADPARGFNYPFLMWNCRWRAGASLEHGHMQMTMAKDQPYPKLGALWLAARRYSDEYGADYFADLYRVHERLGLGVQRGAIRLIASLCPFRDRETLIVGESLDDALAAVVYEVLDILRSRAGVQAFNMGVLLPPVERAVEWQGFPVIVRIIDRLSVAELPSDISGMGIFAGADAIAADPYGVMELLADTR